MRAVRTIFKHLKEAGVEFARDGGTTMAAALAYYALFSIPPLILIVILIAGSVWGEQTAQDNLSRELTLILDKSGAQLILDVMKHVRTNHSSLWASLISAGVLFIGSTGVMVQLQMALNRVWNCEPAPASKPVLTVIFKRIFSFVMVLAVAGLLFASLLATTFLAAAITYLHPYLPATASSWLSYWGNVGVTFVIVVLLLAALFRWVPDCSVYWRDVWLGATVTGVLFMIGKELLGWYLGTKNMNGYGGAGALVLLLMWVYYTSMIVLFGAELTQVWAQRRGHCKYPKANPSSSASTLTAQH